MWINKKKKILRLVQENNKENSGSEPNERVFLDRPHLYEVCWESLLLRLYSGILKKKRKILSEKIYRIRWIGKPEWKLFSLPSGIISPVVFSFSEPREFGLPGGVGIVLAELNVPWPEDGVSDRERMVRGLSMKAPNASIHPSNNP